MSDALQVIFWIHTRASSSHYCSTQPARDEGSWTVFWRIIFMALDFGQLRSFSAEFDCNIFVCFNSQLHVTKRYVLFVISVWCMPSRKQDALQFFMQVVQCAWKFMIVLENLWRNKNISCFSLNSISTDPAKMHLSWSTLENRIIWRMITLYLQDIWISFFCLEYRLPTFFILILCLSSVEGVRSCLYEGHLEIGDVLVDRLPKFHFQ